MAKICNSNENCGETSNSDRREETRSEVFSFQILVQTTRNLVNILVIFSKCFFFSLLSLKGKMLLETPLLGFPHKNTGNPA